MKCFYLRLQGVFFDVEIESESENLGFFTTFAIFSENENLVRQILERELASRFSRNGVKVRRDGFLRSTCWIEEFNAYQEPPEVMPDGFSFFRWRFVDLPGMMFSMMRYNWGSSWRSVRLLNVSSSG